MARFLSRKKFVGGDVGGWDSVQHYLEMATWYSPGGLALGVDLSGNTKIRDELLELEEEGYLKAIWKSDSGSENILALESISLTTEGHKLLAEIREKSAGGKLRRRASDLVWVVGTSVITTIVTLNLRGCSR